MKSKQKLNQIIEQCLQGSEKFVARAHKNLEDKEKPAMVRNLLSSLNTEMAVSYSLIAKELVKLGRIIDQEIQTTK